MVQTDLPSSIISPMWRRLALMSGILIVLACGGGGGGFGDLGQSNYPLTKNLSLRFVNASGIPTNLYQGSDLPTTDNLVGAGLARTESVEALWVSEDDSVSFTFHALPDGGTVQSLTMTVDGVQARSAGFGGFDVSWNGVALSASRGGSDPFPLSKKLTLRLENNSPDKVNFFVNPEIAGDTNAVVPAGIRTLNLTKSWNSSLDQQSFQFNVTPDGGSTMTTSLAVTGDQALDPSLTGYTIRWDGVNFALKRLDDPIYPFSKGFRATFKNDGAVPVNIFTDGEAASPDNLLASGETRTLDVRRSWNSDDEELVFTFVASADGQELYSVPIKIKGAEARTGTTSAFDAIWDGASLQASTH